MTIVMDEDTFSTSLSSLSTLSSSQAANFQTLIGGGRDTLNASYTSSSSASNGSLTNGIVSLLPHQQHNGNNLSPSAVISQHQMMNGNGSDPDQGSPENSPYILFLFRSNVVNGQGNFNNNNNMELFDERKISLSKPCKIGRAVAKLRPEPNNAIFDCKVLSRNHALIWEENGKFYLQDTKSSNGTFLNGNRLGKSNEDSAPFELSSGDIIQFGVDVTENTKKVTHGCITVDIRLFLRPGVELVKKPSAQQSNKVDIQTQELYQLALFLQEAMMREEILNQKLKSLQTFIDQAKEISENGWLTLIQEDRLLSRIDCLEKQSTLNSKNVNEDSLKKTINALREEKLSIENSAKESIEKLIEEKNQLAQKLDEIKVSLCSTQEEEISQLYKINEDLKIRIMDLATRNQEIDKEKDQLQAEFEEIKSRLNEKSEEIEIEKARSESALEKLDLTEKSLTAKIELLIAEKDIQTKQLEGLRNKLEQMRQAELAKEQHALVNGIDSNKENVATLGSGEIVDVPETDNGINAVKSVKTNHILNDVSNSIDDSQLYMNESHDLSKINNRENIKINNLTFNKESNHTFNKKDSFDADFNKLSQEIEFLKLQLQDEKNSNLKLTSEVNRLKTQSASTDDTYEQRENSKKLELELNEKVIKINDLSEELEKKNSFINKLLISKNELLNINFKNIITANGADVDLNNSSLLEDSYNEAMAKTSCYYNDYYSLKEEYTEFKKQIEFIEIAINKFLEDRILLSNKVESKILDDYYTYLDDLCVKMKELKKNLDNKELRMESNLTDAQKEHDLNKQKIVELQDKIGQLVSERDSAQAKLTDSELIVQSIQSDFDSLSLRTKIVSYVSVFPLFILILAVMIAFYPVLATITATGL